MYAGLCNKKTMVLQLECSTCSVIIHINIYNMYIIYIYKYYTIIYILSSVHMLNIYFSIMSNNFIKMYINYIS